MGTFVLGARVLLFAVFATAGIGKLLDRHGTRVALLDFDVPKRAAKIGAVALPLAELATAVLVLPVPTARWGALAALVLLLAFIAGISRAIATGKTVDCHCFGQIHSSQAGPGTLVRNALLAALAAVVVVEGPGPSIDGWIADRSGEELAAVGAGIAAAVFAVIAMELWFRNRTLREKLQEATNEVEAFPVGLPVGVPAPPFQLPDLDGETVTLRSLLALGRPVVLIFTAPKCGGCMQLYPDLGRWQATLSDEISIVLVTTGTPKENQHVSDEHGVSNMLLQDEFEIMRRYRLRKTPSAVLISEEGIIESAPALGVTTIEPMIRWKLDRTAEPSYGAPVVIQQPGA